jgi:DNA-binding NarL/FixJ family response regulator
MAPALRLPSREEEIHGRAPGGGDGGYPMSSTNGVRSISVVVANDLRIVRRGLCALLAGEPGLKVVGEAADGLEAVVVVGRLQPDVLVLDPMMPGIDGGEVTRRIARRAPGTRVVMLSEFRDESHLLEALRAGAAAYVLKDADPRELSAAVREAAAGRRYLSAPFSPRALSVYIDRARTSTEGSYEALTAREREVLRLVVEGFSNAQMGTRLGISPRTADTHRTNLMRKLDQHSQADLVRYAVRRGLFAAPRLPRAATER